MSREEKDQKERAHKFDVRKRRFEPAVERVEKLLINRYPLDHEVRFNDGVGEAKMAELMECIATKLQAEWREIDKLKKKENKLEGELAEAVKERDDMKKEVQKLGKENDDFKKKNEELKAALSAKI